MKVFTDHNSDLEGKIWDFEIAGAQFSSFLAAGNFKSLYFHF